MRYLQAIERQDRYAVSLPETAQPEPATGEVLIRVTASGVNRADLLQIAGRYPPPSGESSIPGLEVSGTRDDTGERVCALLAGGGPPAGAGPPPRDGVSAPPGPHPVPPPRGSQ